MTTASRHQTFIEVALTSLVHRNHFKKNHLVGPPSYQVIALHPRLIYSHLSEAARADGVDNIAPRAVGPEVGPPTPQKSKRPRRGP